MTIWNKLVRDRIPEIIEASNATATIRTLGPSEFVVALKAKLLEEAHELVDASDRQSIMAECADVLEVVDALCEVSGIATTDLRELKQRKLLERGGFRKRVFLLETKPYGDGESEHPHLR